MSSNTSTGHLSESTAIANDVETTVFSIANLAPATYTLKYNIALRAAGPTAMFRKAWCWVDNGEKELIASNIGLPRDWPTSKEVSTQITVTPESGPILIKAMVVADNPVELVHAHEITEKDRDGNDVVKTQGCLWSIVQS